MRTCARPLALTLALVLSAAGVAPAQEAPASGPVPEVRVGTSQGAERVPLAIPELPGDPEASRVVAAVVRNDLEFSGLFELVPEGPSARYTLTGVTERVGDAIKVTVSLAGADSGAPLFAKRYTGGPDALRRIAHRISDVVVEMFTGRPGAFDTRIAFVCDRDKGRDVYLMDWDGENVSRVTSDNSLVLSPEVSPDGQYLFFTSYATGEPAIFVVERSSGVMRRLFSRQGLNQSAALSPDGRRLALSAAFEGNSEIYVSDPEGRNLRRITNNPAIDVSPSWSPNGQQLAFCSDRTGTPQVWIMSADGLDQRPLTREGDFNSEPAIAPDGTTVAFSSRRGGLFQICLVDLASGRITQVTSGACNHESPSWSPDGSFLAYQSDCDGRFDIWAMRRDGTGARRVGRTGVSRTPSWYR